MDAAPPVGDTSVIQKHVNGITHVYSRLQSHDDPKLYMQIKTH